MKRALRNVQAVKKYLIGRALSLSRSNAKQVCAAFQTSQLDAVDNRVGVCVKCRGASI